jgi:hypothetical protein
MAKVSMDFSRFIMEIKRVLMKAMAFEVSWKGF